MPGSTNVTASIIQALAVVASDSYIPKAFHVVVLTIALCTLGLSVNIFFARKLPDLVAVVSTMFIVTYIPFLVVLLTMGERSSAKEVFTDFQDNANWGSIGTACFVGVSASVIALIGSDCAAHLAEELKDASRQLPKAMLATAGTNYILGSTMMIAFLFVVGDVDEILKTPTLQPWVQVIWNATKSRTSTIIMTSFVIFFFLFCSVTCLTTSSRQLFAFARDGGLPFARFVSYVSTVQISVQPASSTHHIQGLSLQKHPHECNHPYLAHRLWFGSHPTRINCCISQHSDYWQHWSFDLIYHLHRLSNASSHHCWSLRPPSKSTTVFPRQDHGSNCQFHSYSLFVLLLSRSYVPGGAKSYCRVNELEFSCLGCYHPYRVCLLHSVTQDLPWSRSWPSAGRCCAYRHGEGRQIL